MRYAPALALILAPLGFAAAPAQAQLANERVLTIFGDDKCPADTICVRAPESERYRIPKALRNSGVIAPENQSWAARANETLDAHAATGTGSCTAVGPGGWTGCYQQQMRAARAERRQAAKESNPSLDQ